MTTSHSFTFDDSEALGISAEQRPKSQPSKAGERLERYVGKWIQVLIGLVILVAVSQLSWFFVPAVLVLAYIIFRQ